MVDQYSKLPAFPWRRFGIISGVALTVLLGGVIIGLVYVGSEAGREKIVELANENMANEESSVYISEIEGSLFSSFNIPLITISDKNGVWLEVHNIDVNWSSLSILGGIVSISDLSIDTMNLLRPPVDSEEEAPADKPFKVPNIPVDIDVKNYTVSKIIISDALADVASEFMLDGEVKLTEDDGIIARTNLVSTSIHNDKVHIDLSYPRDATNINASININAPEDGLLVALIGLDPKQAITVNFEGEGPIENWNGHLNAKVANENIINGLITYQDGPLTFHADFDVRKFVPDNFSSLIDENNSIDITYSNSELSASLITKIARLEANGTETINFSLDLIDPEPINQLIAPAYFKPTKVDGYLDNMAEASISIDNLIIGVENSVEANINGQIKGAMQDQKLNLASMGRLTNINGEAVDGIIGLLKDGVNWNLNVHHNQLTALSQIDDFSITNDFFEISSVGEFNNESGAFDADLVTTVTNISDIASNLNLDQKFSGQLLLNADVKRENIEGPIDAKLSLSTENIDLDNPALNELIGKAPTFVSYISQLPDGAIHISDTVFDAAILKFETQADISPKKVINNGGFLLSFSNIENMKTMPDKAFSGDIDVIGTLSGSLDTPSLQIETGFKLLNIQSMELQDFAAKLEAENILKAPAGSLTITSGTNFGALDLQTSFSGEKNNYQISTINLTLGAYQASGAFELPEGKPIEGALNISTTDKDQSAVAINGNVSADIILTDEENVQNIIVDSEISDLFIPTDENELVTLKSAKVSANALLLENSPQVTLDASLSELMHPAFQSQSMNVNVEQVPDGLQYAMIVQGTSSMPYELKMDGDIISVVDEQQNITVGLEGTIGETPVGFSQPAKINLQGENINVAPFSLTLGSGNINGSLSKTLNDIQASITMDKADISPVQVFVPDMPLSGLISGEMNLTSTDTLINNVFNFQLSNIVFNNQENLASNDITMSLQGLINDESTEISGDLNLNNIFEANYAAAIPLKIEPVTFTAEFAEDQHISGKFNWTGEVTPIWPLLQMPDHDLSGNLDAGISIDGTLNEPNINGEIIMVDGRYENMQTGFLAADLQMSATITDRQFTLDRFSANDGEEGVINATAEIDFDPDLNYSARADLALENTQLVRQPELQVAASSNLTFLKNHENTSLSGDITVENASIGAVEQGGPIIAKLDVTEINTEGTLAATRQQDNSLGAVDLDLNIHVPNQLFILSFGLDSEWQSDLTITGTSEEPIIGGTANLIRGFFEFSGKRFDLKRGNFSFPNDKTNDPIIEIDAEHQLSDMIANLRIFGQASKPTIEMSATPYLPENEVLARILFGTSVAELTAVEAVQLAAAIHSLSNGGGQGLMGGIRRAIGVDRLSIDNDSSREYGTTITGGKYLTDNVYVEVSTAPSTGETATSVEVGLTRNISVVTRRTMDHDNNLSIKWFWDY